MLRYHKEAEVAEEEAYNRQQRQISKCEEDEVKVEEVAVEVATKTTM